MTGEDQFIGWGFALSATAILGLAVMAVLVSIAVRQNARAHARMDPATEMLRERWGWETLRGRFGSAARSDAPARHRASWQMPSWFRTVRTHGQARDPKGYGPPPPLRVVEQPSVSPWLVRDRNVVPSLLNPAVGAASVRRQDRWEALDVARDVLDGRMEAAANLEDTGLIEPIRAEVVR